MEPPASPGSPLRISAADYNAAVEAGRRWRDQGRLGRGPYSSTPQIVSSIVKVRNSTSGSLAAGSVVELNATPMGELSRRNLVFDGVARAGVDPFCAVLINPLDQLEIGPAVIAGAAMAPVNIVDADNTHARVESGSTQLKGDFGGWCRILYKPGGTGVKTCVVSLGNNEEIVRKARTTQSIAQGSSGTVDIFLSGSSRGQATAYYNWFAGGSTIANGADVLVEYSHDEDKWIIIPPPGTTAAPQWCAVSADRDAPWAYFQAGSSTADTTNPIEINNSSGGGIFAFPKQLIGTTSNSLGTMFSVNASPANSSDWAVRIHQRAVFHLTVHTTWQLPPLTLSLANQYLRVAAHGHTYTDDGVAMNTGLTTINALEYETHSAVRVRTTVEGIKTTEVGRSWLPIFYRAGYTFDGAIEYVRYATHSGVISLVPSSFPANIRFRIERDPNDTPLNSIGDPWMRSISFTLHQASDVY